MNVVWSNLGRNNAGAFHREQDLYEFGPQLYDLPECADITDINDGVVIPDSLRGTSETGLRGSDPCDTVGVIRSVEIMV